MATDIPSGVQTSSDPPPPPDAVPVYQVPTPGAENQKKMAKLAREAMGQIEEVLTDDQKKTWKEMVGEPFDTTKLIQRPRQID